jgi:hypothetical protein
MSAERHFEEVWFQHELPKASIGAMSQRRVGVLTISDGRAEFRSGDYVETIAKIDELVIGRRGSDFVNRWIEIHYDAQGVATIAYLKDGRWRGWRPLLTRSNMDIAEALRALR